MIKDSGERRKFNTGAVRDITEGKGRCDLIPLKVAAIVLDADYILTKLDSFKGFGDAILLYEVLGYATAKLYPDVETALLEVSKHFEEGAKKYGEYNWQKGIPVHSYIDSAVRHYLKHRRGDTDEAHDRAFIWNIMCAIWTIENKPEMNEYRK